MKNRLKLIYTRIGVLFLLGNLVSVATVAQTVVSQEYPKIEVTINDSAGLSDNLISMSVNDYFNPDTAHTIILDKYGSPVVDIWGVDNTSGSLLRRKPLRAYYTEAQQTWSLMYLDQGPVLFSPSLDSFEVYELDQTYDARAFLLTPDGKKITMTLEFDKVYDQNDLVAGDSVLVEWSEWYVEDEFGQGELIDVSAEYDDLDVHQYEYHTVFGSTDTAMDPLHGNCVAYLNVGDIQYYGCSNRTLNEILIMVDSEFQRKFFHFGGPNNEFIFNDDGIDAFRAHDLNFIDGTDSTVTISFYSNGDGVSIGGEYAAGKTVLLNLLTEEATFVSESVIGMGPSLAMGSFDYASNSFSPGVVPDAQGLGGFSTILMTELNIDGSPELKVNKTAGPSKMGFRCERYPSSTLSSLLRPTLEIECNVENHEMRVMASKLGPKDEFVFAVDGLPWNGAILNDSTVVLPWEFVGDASVMTRYYEQTYDFNIDKYSEVLSIPENHCSIILSLANEEKQFANLVWSKDGVLYLNGNEAAELFDATGRWVARLQPGTQDVSNLKSGVYAVQFANTSRKILID